MPETTTKSVTPSQAAEPAGGIVYTIGTLGYDFGTEARRDTFKQLMPTAVIGGIEVPSNPYDARQMVDYLADNLSEAKSLIWTPSINLPVLSLMPLTVPLGARLVVVPARLVVAPVRLVVVPVQ